MFSLSPGLLFDIVHVKICFLLFFFIIIIIIIFVFVFLAVGYMS